MFGLPSQSKSRERAAGSQRRKRVSLKTERKKLVKATGEIIGAVIIVARIIEEVKTVKLKIVTRAARPLRDLVIPLMNRAIANPTRAELALINRALKSPVLTNPVATGLPVRKTGAVTAKRVNAAVKLPRAIETQNHQANPAETLAQTAKPKTKKPTLNNIAANPAVTGSLIIRMGLNPHNATAGAQIKAAENMAIVKGLIIGLHSLEIQA